MQYWGMALSSCEIKARKKIQALISKLLNLCVKNCDNPSFIHIFLRSSNACVFIYSLVLWFR